VATPEELSRRYLEMSLKFIRQAQEELENRNDLAQASEKAWGAAPQALKSIAAQRGWNHKNHGLLRDMATQIYMEFGRPRILDLFGCLEGARTNFYEHRFDRDEVQYQINNSRYLLEELDMVRSVPPRGFSPANREQERRLEQLTRFNSDTAAGALLDLADLPPV
jgi:hypothetical protein